MKIDYPCQIIAPRVLRNSPLAKHIITLSIVSKSLLLVCYLAINTSFSGYAILVISDFANSDNWDFSSITDFSICDGSNQNNRTQPHFQIPKKSCVKFSIIIYCVDSLQFCRWQIINQLIDTHLKPEILKHADTFYHRGANQRQGHVPVYNRIIELRFKIIT